MSFHNFAYACSIRVAQLTSFIRDIWSGSQAFGLGQWYFTLFTLLTDFKPLKVSKFAILSAGSCKLRHFLQWNSYQLVKCPCLTWKDSTGYLNGGIGIVFNVFDASPLSHGHVSTFSRCTTMHHHKLFISPCLEAAFGWSFTASRTITGVAFFWAHLHFTSSVLTAAAAGRSRDAWLQRRRCWLSLCCDSSQEVPVTTSN